MFCFIRYQTNSDSISVSITILKDCRRSILIASANKKAALTTSFLHNQLVRKGQKESSGIILPLRLLDPNRIAVLHHSLQILRDCLRTKKDNSVWIRSICHSTHTPPTKIPSTYTPNRHFSVDINLLTSLVPDATTPQTTSSHPERERESSRFTTDKPPNSAEMRQDGKKLTASGKLEGRENSTDINNNKRNHPVLEDKKNLRTTMKNEHSRKTSTGFLQRTPPPPPSPSLFPTTLTSMCLRPVEKLQTLFVGRPSHTSQPHCGQAVGILLPTLHLLDRPHHCSSRWQQRREKNNKRWSSDAVLRCTAETRTNSDTPSSRRLLLLLLLSPSFFPFCPWKPARYNK